MKSAQEVLPLKESGEHSYHRRSFYHDYHNPFIYHIILKKKKDCEDFGSITGNARIAYQGIPVRQNNRKNDFTAPLRLSNTETSPILRDA